MDQLVISARGLSRWKNRGPFFLHTGWNSFYSAPLAGNSPKMWRGIYAISVFCHFLSSIFGELCACVMSFRRPEIGSVVSWRDWTGLCRALWRALCGRAARPGIHRWITSPCIRAPCWALPASHIASWIYIPVIQSSASCPDTQREGVRGIGRGGVLSTDAPGTEIHSNISRSVDHLLIL